MVDGYGVFRGAQCGLERLGGSQESSGAGLLAFTSIVAAGLADRLELQVSYAIGVARPLSLFVDTFGTGKVSDEEIIRLINEHFDLRPAGIIQSLDLLRPIYQPTAAFGHFGRTDIDAPWEVLDKVPMLRKGSGANVESSEHAPGLALTQGEMLE